MARIFIIEDDEIMAECIARAINPHSPVNPNSQESALPNPNRTSSTNIASAPNASRNLNSSDSDSSVRTRQDLLFFTNAIAAISALSDHLPDLIILDVLLNGPDGFSFLNELSSYTDTMQIPIIIISSLELHAQRLRHYHIEAILQKETMLPSDIHAAVQKALAQPTKYKESATHAE